jgi:hypothetical protein
MITEGEQAAEIRDLQRTYDFLLRQPPRDLQNDQTLAGEIVRGLAQIEEEAHRDNAPAFCDEPGIGLPEPDPMIPHRPAVLRPPDRPT